MSYLTPGHRQMQQRYSLYDQVKYNLHPEPEDYHNAPLPREHPARLVGHPRPLYRHHPDNRSKESREFVAYAKHHGAIQRKRGPIENGLCTPRLGNSTKLPQNQKVLPPIVKRKGIKKIEPKRSEGEPERRESYEEKEDSRRGDESRLSSVSSMSLPATGMKFGSYPSTIPGSAQKRAPSFRSGGYFIDSFGNLRESRTDFVKSSFDVKFDELHKLKETAQVQMNKFNAVRVDLQDWLSRQQERFLNAIKSTKANMPTLVPDSMCNIYQVRIVAEACRALSHRTRNRVYDYEQIYTFLGFFDRILAIKQDMVSVLLEPLRSYAQSVSTLRIPGVLDELEQLEDELNTELDEEYDFSELNNERENLRTYSVGVFDRHYFNMIHFLPYLLRKTTKLCYVVRHIHLEKE